MQIRPPLAARSITRRGTLLRPAAALLAIGLVAAACGGSDDDPTAAVASLDETPAATAETTAAEPVSGEQSDEESMLAFSQCVRENGVDGFPDPTVDADGNLTFDVFGSGIEIGTDTFDDAIASCESLVEGTNLAAGQGIDQTEVEDTMLEFTECLRSEGIDVGDFTFPQGGPPGAGEDGGFELSGTRNELLALVLGLDADDPAVETAIEACEPLLAGLGQPGNA